jgi:hypothetical protein
MTCSADDDDDNDDDYDMRVTCSTRFTLFDLTTVMAGCLIKNINFETSLCLTLFLVTS